MAQFKFTALVGTAGAKRITEHPLPYVSSEYSVEDATLKELLSTTPSFASKSLAKKKKKSAKKQKSETDASSSAPATTTTTTTTTPTEAAPMDTN